MPSAVSILGTALLEAGEKIRTGVDGILREKRGAWVHRIIYSELAKRAKLRGPAYWDELFPGLPLEERAECRIRRMITRATIAGTLAATGATTAVLVSLATEGALVPVAVPLGLASVGAESTGTSRDRWNETTSLPMSDRHCSGNPCCPTSFPSRGSS
jgi:hypothetical protein